MNYIIEDNINFFDKLNKIDKIDNTKNITDSSLCLLTHQTLEKNYITLDCSHNFNYIPLYKEICCQKMPTYLETTNLSGNGFVTSNIEGAKIIILVSFDNFSFNFFSYRIDMFGSSS